MLALVGPKIPNRVVNSDGRGPIQHASQGSICVLYCVHEGKRSTRDEAMSKRAMSSEPTAAGARNDRQRAAERRSVSVIEHSSRGQAAARAQPLLA